MPPTKESAIDSDTQLIIEEQVKKGKARRFFLINKGAALQTLVAFKKGQFDTLIQKAKKNGFKGEVTCGVISGQGQKLFLQLAGNEAVAETMKVDTVVNESPCKKSKLRKFLKENGLKFNPSIHILMDTETAPDPDSDEAVSPPPQNTETGNDEDQLSDPTPIKASDTDTETNTATEEMESKAGRETQDSTTAVPETLQEQPQQEQTQQQEEQTNPQTQSTTPPAPSNSPTSTAEPEIQSSDLSMRFNKIRPRLEAAIRSFPDEAEDLQDLIDEFQQSVKINDLIVAEEWLEKMVEALEELPEPPENEPEPTPSRATVNPLKVEFESLLKQWAPQGVAAVKSGDPRASQLLEILNAIKGQRAQEQFVEGTENLKKLAALLQSPQPSSETSPEPSPPQTPPQESPTTSTIDHEKEQLLTELKELVPRVKEAIETAPEEKTELMKLVSAAKNLLETGDYRSAEMALSDLIQKLEQIENPYTVEPNTYSTETPDEDKDQLETAPIQEHPTTSPTPDLGNDLRAEFENEIFPRLKAAIGNAPELKNELVEMATVAKQFLKDGNFEAAQKGFGQLVHKLEQIENPYTVEPNAYTTEYEEQTEENENVEQGQNRELPPQLEHQPEQEPEQQQEQQPEQEQQPPQQQNQAEEQVGTHEQVEPVPEPQPEVELVPRQESEVEPEINLSEFKNDGFIGEGMYGKTYRFKNDKGMSVVVKKVKDPRYNAAFEKDTKHEANMYEKIGDHPNFAKCFGFQKHEGDNSLVLESIEGKDAKKGMLELRLLQESGAISSEQYWGTLQYTLAKMTEAVAHMSKQGIVHLDIKPDNVMIDSRTGEIKIIDFGTAVELGEKFDKRPPIPSNFNAPQLFYGERATSDKSDIFGVGSTAYMWTENRLFSVQRKPNQQEEDYQKEFATGQSPSVQVKSDEQRSRERNKKTEDQVENQQQSPEEQNPESAAQKLESRIKDAETCIKNYKNQIARIQGGYSQLWWEKLLGSSEPASALAALEELFNEAKRCASSFQYTEGLAKLEEFEQRRKNIIQNAGKFELETDYTKFLNATMHGDEGQRLTPEQALEHPFLKNRLLSDEEAQGVLCAALQPNAEIEYPDPEDDDDIRINKLKKARASLAGKLNRVRHYLSEDAADRDILMETISIAIQQNRADDSEWDAVRQLQEKITNAENDRQVRNEFRDQLVTVGDRLKKLMNPEDQIAEDPEKLFKQALTTAKPGGPLEAGKEILQKLEDRANHLDRLKSLKDIENEIIRFKEEGFVIQNDFESLVSQANLLLQSEETVPEGKKITEELKNTLKDLREVKFQKNSLGIDLENETKKIRCIAIPFGGLDQLLQEKSISPDPNELFELASTGLRPDGDTEQAREAIAKLKEIKWHDRVYEKIVEVGITVLHDVALQVKNSWDAAYNPGRYARISSDLERASVRLGDKYPYGKAEYNELLRMLDTWVPPSTLNSQSLLDEFFLKLEKLR